MTGRRALAGAALTLAALAAVSGSPYGLERRPMTVGDLAALLADADGRLRPLTLASWIREQRSGLRVLDLRRMDAVEAYRIPTAEPAGVDELGRLDVAAGDVLVLYDEDGTRAAQSWILLKAAGVPDVWFLDRGLTGWLDDVMAPVIGEDASPEAREAFEGAAELSRYFGGRPRIVAPGEVPRAAPAVPGHGDGPSGDRLRPRLRRGCG